MSMADIGVITGLLVLLYFALRHQIVDFKDSVTTQIEAGKEEHQEFRRRIEQLQKQHNDLLLHLLGNKPAQAAQPAQAAKP